MTVEDKDVVDIISREPATGDTVLTISDHLDWTDPLKHLLALQSKINRYLAFIESGEMCEKYPTSKGSRVVIEVVFQYPPDSSGLDFLEKTNVIVEESGLAFRWRNFARGGNG